MSDGSGCSLNDVDESKSGHIVALIGSFVTSPKSCHLFGLELVVRQLLLDPKGDDWMGFATFGVTICVTLLTFFSVVVRAQSLVCGPAAFTFSSDTYLQECGGRFYPKCDKPELNQWTIFERARGEALKTNKKILLIFGADWCPPCIVFDRFVKSNSGLFAELSTKFVFVKIDFDQKSARQVMEYLGRPVRSIPNAFVVDPVLAHVIRQIRVDLAVQSPELFREVVLEGATPQTLLARRLFNNSSVRQFINVALPSSRIVTNIDVIKNPNEPAALKMLVNQGFAQLYMFHYLEAARTFHHVSLNYPRSIWGPMGLLLALLNNQTGYDRNLVKTTYSRLREMERRLPDNSREKDWLSFLLPPFAIKTESSLEFGDYHEMAATAESRYDRVVEKYPNDPDLLSIPYIERILTFHSVRAQAALDVTKSRPHLGLSHFLTHHLENSEQVSGALEYAAQTTALAPWSPHAYHMEGHLLPMTGRWREAVEKFDVAHRKHLEWAQRERVPVHLDWHYSHNFVLRTVATMVDRGSDSGIRLAKDACHQQSMACLQLSPLLMISLSESEFRQTMDGLFGKFLTQAYFEMAFIYYKLKNGEAVEIPIEQGAYSDSQILSWMQKLFTETNPDAITVLAHEIDKEIHSQIIRANFDGWSRSFLDMFVLLKIAKSRNLTTVTNQAIETLKEIFPEQFLKAEFGPR